MAKIYDAKIRSELESFINLVAETILQENLSLFLGAGSSMQYNAMSWNELINAVYNGCDNWGNTDRAQYAELNGIDVKSAVCNIVTSVPVNSNKVDTYLNYLLDFDYKSLWTTNYDSVIENVLQSKSKTFIPVYMYKHFKQLSYPGGYFLFKINGSSEETNSIVITREDFINYRKSHEAYLILLKRELLCHSFLFLGCSFDDDILRICIKDILNCIENSSENFSTNHFAIIVESKNDKLDFISKDLTNHYNINCLKVSNPNYAYKIAIGISYRVKFNSIFISGAKSFVRHSFEEENGKKLCINLVSAFMNVDNSPFKFISGMGMSIGHFISGAITQICKVKNTNINRYLQMQPFPFSSKNDNEIHRQEIIKKAGVFIFIYGDFDGNFDNIEGSGMWREYIEAKKDKNNIIISLPCGEHSISKIIYEKEKENICSFSHIYKNIIDKFNHMDIDDRGCKIKCVSLKNKLMHFSF